MMPELPSLFDTSHTFRMLAIIHEWEGMSASHTDNTGKYVSLLLSKAGLETVIFYLWCQKRYTIFMSVCSLSIILADWVMTILMAALWLLGPVHSFTPCFILTNASATYAALPLPMILLGLTDYLLGDKALSNRRAFFKTLGNVFLTLLVWLIAFTCSFSYVDAKLMDMSCGKRLKKALVCEVEESKLVINFIAGIFTAILLTLLPFCSHIPQWVRDADRLCEAEEEQEKIRDDLPLTLTLCPETEGDEKSYPTDTIRHRPPLWISLILGFATFWMPFLAVSLACLVFGLGVPAYISVNLLWLECTNSLLLGVLFWVKTKSPRPHTNLPENLCSWHIYWHISREMQPELMVPELNPPKEKINIYDV
ncbi:unnamed protein product [Oreochromis niloticus]|nr:unnamed protein product [Mustela putorius furo]